MEQSISYIHGSVRRYLPAFKTSLSGNHPSTPKRRFPVPFQHSQVSFFGTIRFPVPSWHSNHRFLVLPRHSSHRFPVPFRHNSLGFRHLSNPNLVFRHHHFLSKDRFPTSLCPNFRKYLWSSVFLFPRICPAIS